MIPISVKIENDLPIKNTNISIDNGPFVVFTHSKWIPSGNLT